MSVCVICDPDACNGIYQISTQSEGRMLFLLSCTFNTRAKYILIQSDAILISKFHQQIYNLTLACRDLDEMTLNLQYKKVISNHKS